MKLTDLMYSNDYISDLSAPSLFPTGTNKSILSGFLFYFFLLLLFYWRVIVNVSRFES